MAKTQRDSFGPYSLVRLLGEGAMGAVYEGEHRETGARHALKLILPQEGRIPGVFNRRATQPGPARASDLDKNFLRVPG